MDFNICCGCGACSDFCPTKAIAMKEDKKGFIIPFIDKDLCINCGYCKDICNINNKIQLNNKAISYHYFKSKNKEILKKSSSGGVFYSVASKIIKDGGIVYGAVFDKEEKKVKHVEANTIEQLYPMMGSKYVQSDTVGIYKKIKDQLKAGKSVLFSGTPCQCAQLLKITEGINNNLFVIDLMCHGVPSPKIFKEHIKLWEEKMGSDIIDYQFRNKTFGYEHNHLAIFKNGSSDKSIDLKRILKLYSFSMRKCCYSCPYTSRNRVGDITIGDLWEAGTVANDFEHNGTSTLLINTAKGQKLINDIKESAIIGKINPESINPDCFSKPVEWKTEYDSFWNDYFTYNYEFVLNKYGKSTIKSKVYQSMLRVLYITKLDKIYLKLKSRILDR